MAKVLLTGLCIVLINIVVGCRPIDSGASTLLSDTMKTEPTASAPSAGEADHVEQVAVNRQAYRNALNSLISFYEKTGNNMKLRWANDELGKLDGIPQYNYVPEAAVAPETLRATEAISEADYMYKDGVRLQKDAGWLIVTKDEKKLREALNVYNQLIKKFPTSNKIGQAAYMAGGICEHFRDYTLAVIYYKRAFQWDSTLPYPAKYKAAYILDTYLQQRDEALELYKQALAGEKLDMNQKDYANLRITAIMKSQKSPE